MVNKAMIIGRLGKDPEVRYSGDGNMITTFTVATDESWKGKDGSKQKKTEWHNVVAFGKLAEICGKYLVKGSMVYIGGRIQTDSYEKDGIKRYSTKIVATDMKMLGGKQATQEAPPEASLTDEEGVPF